MTALGLQRKGPLMGDPELGVRELGIIFLATVTLCRFRDTLTVELGYRIPPKAGMGIL